jgi:quinol monooxygenase YgiN
MIVVIGRVVIQQGHLERALELSLEHVARSRQEPGCVSHGVSRDAENPFRLVFVEEWSDAAALQEHFARPESRAFVQQLYGISIQAPEMTVYEGTETGRA